MTLVSSAFDLIATLLLSKSMLLGVPASITQMLQISSAVFTPVLSYFVFKKAIKRQQIFGIFVIFTGLCAVSASFYLAGSGEQSNENQKTPSLLQLSAGILLTILAYFTQSTQNVIEQYAMQRMDCSPA